MSTRTTVPADPVPANPFPVGANRRSSPARRRKRAGVTARIVGSVLVSLIILFPLYWMLVVAFSPRSELLGGALRLWPRSLTTTNFERVFDAFPVGTWFSNSVAIAFTVAILTVGVNLLGGYALAQLRFRGATTIFLIALTTLMIPVQVTMVPLFQLVTDLKLYGTYWAVILPTAANAFGLFLARQFILAIPRDLIEAARIDGAGHLRVFRSIVLPLSKPLIAVLFFMTLLQSWNDFAWPLIALKQNELFTLPIGLLYLQGQFGSDYGGTMAFALVNVIPMVILFLSFQRYFVQGFARSGIK